MRHDAISGTSALVALRNETPSGVLVDDETVDDEIGSRHEASENGYRLVASRSQAPPESCRHR
jgi:hypothetical protein